MAHGFAFALFPIVEEGAIEAVLENRAKGGDGARLYRDAAPAGGVDARGAISSRQGENAQAGPKVLLGVRTSGHDRFAQGGGRGSDLLGVGDERAGVHAAWRR